MAATHDAVRRIIDALQERLPLLDMNDALELFVELEEIARSEDITPLKEAIRQLLVAAQNCDEHDEAIRRHSSETLDQAIRDAEKQGDA